MLIIDKNKIYLRRAQLIDALLVYKWAIDPKIRKYSINQELFTFESHMQWFKNKINSQDTQYFILMESFPIGQIRFDKHQDGWLISFLIDELFQGHGLGKEIVIKGINEIGNGVFYAYVLEKNIPSIKIFEKLNFKQIDVGNEFKHLKIRKYKA